MKTARTREQAKAHALGRMTAGEPLSTGQAAILLGFQTRSLARMVREGKIRAIRNGDGPLDHWRIPADEVARLILAREGDRQDAVQDH